MKRLVNAITCTRFVFALILVLAVPGLSLYTHLTLPTICSV